MASACLGFSNGVVFPGQEFWRHFFLYQSALFSWYQFKIGLLVYVLDVWGRRCCWPLSTFATIRTGCSCVIWLVRLSLESLLSERQRRLSSISSTAIFLVSVLVPALLARKDRGRVSFPRTYCFFWQSPCLRGSGTRRRLQVPGVVRQFDAVQSYFRRNFPAPCAGHRPSWQATWSRQGFDTPFPICCRRRSWPGGEFVSDEHLLKQIRAGWFSLIVLDFDLNKETDPIWLNYYLTQDARDAIASEYRVVDSLQVPPAERSCFRRTDFTFISLNPASYREIRPPGRRAATLPDDLQRP